MNGQREELERALSYPFGVLDRSFALVEGEAVDLAAAEVDRSRRIPLLAYGSNAAPAVLARKLGSGAQPVPVVQATLRDLDAAYSAHVTGYGSVPATLRRSPGTELMAFVAFPTHQQLEQISTTEPNYELDSLRVECQMETGQVLTEAHAYLSRHGCLLVDGSAAAVHEIGAHNRALPELSQRQVLERLRSILLPTLPFDEFVHECIAGRVSAPRSLGAAFDDSASSSP